MSQLEDLWVPRSQVQAEEKRRLDAEKRLGEVLRYLDPQPKGGPIYAVPFPEPGDLRERMVALAERWEAINADMFKAGAVEYVNTGYPAGYGSASEAMDTMIRELRRALGEHAAKGTEKPEWLYGPRTVVYAEEGLCIESLLVKAWAARTLEEAHDLIGEGAVSIEEKHVCESHWRGTDQEITLYVGKSFVRQVRITSEPDPRHGVIIPDGVEKNPD